MELAETLVGTKRVRYGPRPSPENMDILERRLAACVREGRTVVALTKWGATKGYGQFATMNRADLLDYKAMEMLCGLHASVCRHHPPGIQFHLMWEDTTEALMTGYCPGEYLASFRELLTFTRMHDLVAVIPESGLLGDNRSDYLLRVQAMADIIASGHASELGWKGPVDWAYHMERARAEHPRAGEEELRTFAALYLACGLARYEFGVHPEADVTLSFCPYPPSVPDCMRRGRLEYKVKPSSNSHKTAAPWTNFGLLRDDGDWTTVSVTALRHGGYRPATVDLDGLTVPVLREDR